MKDLSSGLLAVFGWIFTLAIVSVIVSRRADTAAVIQSTGSAVGNIVGQAVAPVTGVGAGTGGIGSSGGALSTLHSISSGLSDLQSGFGSGVVNL